MTDEVNKLDVKDFELMSEIHDNDRFMMTQAANAHFAAAMPFGAFKEKVLKPIIESSKPNGMGCEIFTSIDEYNAITELDPKTLYVIIEEGKITQAFLGEYPFAVGGSGGDDSGIPVEQVYLDLNSLLLELGESRQLNATYQPADATNPVMTWTTSNHLVATISNGLVTSVGKGECIIKVKARSGAYAECIVTVEVTLVGLSFSSSNDKLVSGYTTQLVPVSVPETATLALSYGSSNTSIATVDQNGLVTPVASTGNVTITALNKNGVRATVTMQVVPFAVSVSCLGINPEDSSVQSIFSVWNLATKGNPTHYKYTETVKAEDGTISTVQTLADWVAMPEDGTVQIELYAEFGYKYINWTFKDTAGNEESVVCPLIYKEPDLELHSFDIEFECSSAEEAAAITMDIPHFKYDKDLFINERCDDGYRPLICEALRYCNRELTEKSTPNNWREGYTDKQVANLAAGNKFRSPRHLGYSDGCGNFINFIFDSCTMDFFQDDKGNWKKMWELKYDGASEWTCGSTGLNANMATIKKLCDYGGHILLHNLTILPTDAAVYTPKYANDFTYCLSRNIEIIEQEFGYTPNHFANPDGKGYYTYPCIKSPKTYMLSAGGDATKVFTDEWAGKYGKPAHRQVYTWDSDFSTVPLSEIRNCLLVNYEFWSDAPYKGNRWIEMLYKAINYGQKKFKAELQHGIGNHEANYRYYDLLHDYCGIDGLDNLMVASGDEFIEYMYYQRVAKITKTVEGNTASFNIQITIPGCFDFKTYSVKAHNLPAGVTVKHSMDVTYFAKNLATGLINFGYNQKALERAQRYYQAYIDNPTNETLDKVLYFTGLLGECNTYNLPVLNQVPAISDVTLGSDQTDIANYLVTVTNSNKEWGEAHTLEVSETEDFATYESYRIVYRKFYDANNSESLSYDFNIRLKAVFDTAKTYYFRYRNRFGVSNVVSKSITLTAVVQSLAAKVDSYYVDTQVRIPFTSAGVLQVRCKVNGIYTDYVDAYAGNIQVTLTSGNNTLEFEGVDSIGRTITQTYNTILYAKEWESKMIIYAAGGNYYAPSTVALTATDDGYSRLPNHSTAKTPVCDTNKISRGTVSTSSDKRQTIDGVSCDITNKRGYTKETGDNSAIYKDEYIDECLFTADYNAIANYNESRNYRIGYKFTNLAAGKYIAKLFIRNMMPNNKAHGIAIVTTTHDASTAADYYNYITSREFCMEDLYDNKDKTVDVPFEVTDTSLTYFVGIDRRADIYGNMDGCDKYDIDMYPALKNGSGTGFFDEKGGGSMVLHLNLVHLIKIME